MITVMTLRLEEEVNRVRNEQKRQRGFGHPRLPEREESALQCTGCFLQPPKAARLGQNGRGQSHGAAGSGGEGKGEDVRQAEDLFCRSGSVQRCQRRRAEGDGQPDLGAQRRGAVRLSGLQTAGCRAERAEQLPHEGGNAGRDQGAEGRVRRITSATGQDQICHKSHHTTREREGLQRPRCLCQRVEKEEETGFRHDQRHSGRLSKEQKGVPGRGGSGDRRGL